MYLDKILERWWCILKEKKLWTCEYCQTDYAFKANAEKCEANHKKKLKVIHKRYLPMNNDGSGLPIAITIEAEDGTVQIYKKG